ncbi:MAG: DUF927 domain-containing protein [Methylococcales bacterium]|nr:DUF927 domain-containing protein [Methylococcales bacterium]
MSKQPPNFKRFEDAPESAPPIATHKAKNGNGKISAISKPQKTRRKGKMDAIQRNEQALSQVENAADYKGIESIEIDGINHAIQQNQALGTIDLSRAIDPATTPPDNVDKQAPSTEERPCFKCHLDFWQDHHGKTQRAGVWYHSLSKGEDPAPVDTWVCGEILVEAIARDTTGRSFGQVLRFKNRLGEWQTWNMPTRLLAGRGEELLRELMDMGLGFNYHKRSQIAAYICSINQSKTVWTASQVGWFDTENFVLPDATIGKDSDGILFQTESNNHQEYNTAGTLADWRGNVAALCAGNPILLFTVSTAFAGALLKPCNMDGVGFHIFGDSSKGKTTGLKLAASVWGNWEKYKRVWKSTANGLEGAAALFNDGLLTLDEIGDSEAKELADSLYLLGNGTGKQRANVSGHAKAVKTWRIAILSNGEKTIEAHLSEKGLTVKAGQLIRFLQIPLFGQYGAFDELHSYEGGGALAGAIVKQANQAYGVAGREYLNQLTQDPNTLEQCPQHLDAALKRFTARFGELSAQEARAAKSFALVGIAGELATQYGVTGWNDGAAFDAALTCFEHWRGYRGQGDTEYLQIVEQIRAYLEMYGDARFTSITDDTRLHGERSGYWRNSSNGGREWLFTKAGLQQATKGYDIKQIVGALKEVGWLMLDGEGKSTKLANFLKNETGSKRFYIVTPQDNECNTVKTGVTSVTKVTRKKYPTLIF